MASRYVHQLVQPHTHCPHLPSSYATQYPSIGSPCHSCKSLQENWVCLTCQIVGCGRHVNGHMLAHSQSADGHAVAMSYSDLSVWCIKCGTYLDTEEIPQLRSVFALIHRMKFGEDPPNVKD